MSSQGDLRVRGDIQAISLSPELKTYHDYKKQVGKRRPLTEELAQELLREGVADQYSFTIHPTYDRLGNLLPRSQWERGNLVVNGGLTRVQNLVFGGSFTPFTMCAVGSSGTTPEPTDTGLNAIILPYQNVTYAYISGSNVIWDTSFAAGSNQGTWREAGLFDSSQVMGSHALFNSPVTKGSSNQVITEQSWTVAT